MFAVSLHKSVAASSRLEFIAVLLLLQLHIVQGEHLALGFWGDVVFQDSKFYRFFAKWVAEFAEYPFFLIGLGSLHESL